MRAYLRALLASWGSTMSGAASIILWLTSAILETVGSAPVSVRLGFIIAAFGSLFYASYRVWKKEHDAYNTVLTSRAVNQQLANFHAEGGGLRTGIITSDDASSVQ